MKKRPKDVDAYIASAPRSVQSKLKELRRIIKKTAPAATEKISYGMPYYHYKGRLAYFAAAKAHIGLYIPTPVIEEHAKELRGYDADRATVRLQMDRKLPAALIAKLIRARMKKNDKKHRK